MSRIVFTLKGGPGSGHRGHAGRPGQVGGSVPGGFAVSIRTGRAAAVRAGWKPEPKKPSTSTDSQLKPGTLYGDISKRDMTSIKKVVRILPQEHLDMVGIIRTRKWISGDPAGDCDPSGNVTLYGGAKGMRGGRMWKTGDVVHEIGHAVHFHMSKMGIERMRSRVKGMYSKLRGKSGLSRREFRKVSAGGGYDGKRVRGFPSKYSQKNEYELFAESYEMYVRSPARLLRLSPDMYTMMKDKVFNGVEYVK